MKSLVTKYEVKTWLDSYPEYKFRSMSYKATARYIEQRYPHATGALYVQLSVLVHRRIQEILPPDEKGYALAAQYLVDNGYVSKETAREGQIFCRGQWYKIV